MKRTSPYQIDVLRRVEAGEVLRRAPDGSGPPSWYWEGGAAADHYACNGALHRKVPLLGLAEGSSIFLLTHAGREALERAQQIVRQPSFEPCEWNPAENRPAETTGLTTHTGCPNGATDAVTHLWEVKHSYYCNEGNYFASESVETHYKTFPEFMSANGDSDFDMNLVFRWDWEEEDEDGEPSFTGDINYRNGNLKIYWMGQRKGLYRYSTIEVCRADEPCVIEFLRPRLEHLVALWLPLSPALDPRREG